LSPRIIIEYLDRNRDGLKSAIFTDLERLPRGVRSWLLAELRRLSDEAILNRCERLDSWPASAEGRWVLLRLAPYILLCQLELWNLELFRFGGGSGILKLVRVVHENYAAEVLEREKHAAEDDDDADSD
jgi:hypothetical protein